MERWATVKRLHQAALDSEPSQRAAFLDEACAGDEAPRHEVESLLAYQEAAEPFMESPALEVTARSASQEPSIPLVGRTLSHYHVVALLGAGGMGEVYLARDPRLERAVALKILPPDLAFDADRMQRFTREAKAASALNHPNVATIYDIGESKSDARCTSPPWSTSKARRLPRSWRQNSRCIHLIVSAALAAQLPPR